MADAQTRASAIVSALLEMDEPSPEELVRSVKPPLRFPMAKDALEAFVKRKGKVHWIEFRIPVPASVYVTRQADIDVLNDWVSDYITGDATAMEGISYTAPSIVHDHVVVTVGGDIANYLADDER